jgi:serine/threonine protein kinase/Flp pilus assembly protein TadD
MTPGSVSEPADVQALVERLAEAMAWRWQAGERPLVEEYLVLHPELRDPPEAALELLAEELALRQEYGEEVAASDLLARFPRWPRQVQALLDCHRVLAPRLAGPRFPAAGETLGGFRLIAELGRGGRGRVYLAAQTGLADRPVVLKLSPAADREHLSLARLQHTHVVPLHSVHDFPERGLRALCQPYFGGATLAELLRALGGRPAGRLTGDDLLGALRQAQAAAATAVPVEGPACDFLSRSHYVAAVCWIGACLADALQYAHERGLIHLDLKPANVLLAADGMPMLLDFHLARPPLPAGARPPEWLGGTPGYMAPEHVTALVALREDGAVRAGLDGRADLFALGVLLAEALGGPPLPEELRRNNPAVTPGLADLLARCTAADPADRYPTAADLAADLRRHLADRPLRGVRNRSLPERLRKWRRRRPFALPLLALLAVLAAPAGPLFVHAGRQADRARSALREGEDDLVQGHPAKAVETFRYGAALAEGLPFQGDLRRELHDGMRRAERARQARELHRIAERLRPLFGVESIPPAQARAVAEHCRGLWRELDLIGERLGSNLELQCRADLLDLAILAAHLGVRGAAPAESRAAAEEALALLAEAESVFGPSCVLCRERERYARALGQTGLAEACARQAAALAPRGAWEHTALGRARLRAGDVRGAAEEIDRALREEPQALWPNFYKGCCALRLGDPAEAMAAFSACVVLAPDSAWCRHNRGLAYLELGRLDAAVADFDQALALDPALGAAALGRAIARYRSGHYPAALADLRAAEEKGAAPAAVAYNRALVHLARDDHSAAVTGLREALRHDPGHAPARDLLARLSPDR